MLHSQEKKKKKNNNNYNNNNNNNNIMAEQTKFIWTNKKWPEMVLWSQYEVATKSETY